VFRNVPLRDARFSFTSVYFNYSEHLAAARVSKVVEILLFVWQNQKSWYKYRFRFL
jgi:hypothetical protein